MFGGTVNNVGTIKALGGKVTFSSDEVNQANGTVEVDKNGTLVVDGKTSGGIVHITSGMLEIGQPAGMTFLSTLSLDGPSATVQVDNATDLRFTFSQQNNAVELFATYSNGNTAQAALQLDHNHFYAAADFSISHNQLLYVAHPLS